MKIAIIIPDRNDRPELLTNLFRMLKRQTVQPDIIELVNDTPLNDQCDITYRYRIGYERLRNKNLDLIFLMENDDYYADDYLETMIEQFKKQPAQIIGTSYTIYYHVIIRKWLKLTHPNRSSAMSTALRPDLQINWGRDDYAYTDLTLWKQLNGYTFDPQKIICLGIKHGSTLTGGKFHNDRLDHYTNDDENFSWFENNADIHSAYFYRKFGENLKRLG